MSKWEKFNSSKPVQTKTQTTSKPSKSVALSAWDKFNNTPKDKPKVITGPAKEEPGLGKQIAAGILKTPARLATNLVQAGQIATGKEKTTPFSGDFLGDVQPIGNTGKGFKEDLKDAVGAGLELSSYIPIAKGASVAFKAGKWKKFIAPLAGEGAVSGALAGTGSELSNNAVTGEKIDLKKIALASAIGTVAAPIAGAGFGVLGKAFGRGGAKVAEEVAPKVELPTATVPEPKFNELQLPAPKPKEAPAIPMGGKQYKGAVEVQQAKKNPVTINPKTGKFQTTYSSSEGETIAQRVIETDVKPGAVPQVPKEVSPATLPEATMGGTPRLVRAPSSRLPSTKGDTVAKAAQDIDDSLVKRGFDSLPDEEKARFNSVSRAEQVQEITKVIKDDVEGSVEMALGRKKIPKEVDPQILFNTIAKKAEADGNYDLLRDLAKSPIATQRSILAQKLGAAGVNKSKNSVVDVIADNDRSIAENILKKTGKTVEELQATEIAKIKAKKPPVTKQTFSDFIREIRC